MATKPHHETYEDIIHHPKLFGESLRRLRTAAQMSVQQAAEGLGVSKSLLSMVESGQRTAKFEDILGLMRLYKYPFAWFLTQTRDSFRQSVVDAPLDERAGAIVQSRTDALVMTGKRDSESLPRLLLLRPLRSRSDSEWLELFLPPHTQLTEKPIAHFGEVRGVVQHGTLLLVVDNDEYRVREGEEFCFDGARPHLLRNYLAEPTLATLVITPAAL